MVGFAALILSLFAGLSVETGAGLRNAVGAHRLIDILDRFFA
ncbi:MAG: hypothetical protein VCD31_07795 [Alphaproteobacteria bacterium]